MVSKLFSFLFVSQILFCHADESYKWVDSNSKPTTGEFFTPLIPAGKFGYWKAYICRSKVNGYFVPGAVHRRPYRDSSCTVYENHKLQNVTDFEVLESSPGCLSWVPVTDRNVLPGGALPVGQHQDGSVAYSCRFLNAQGHLLPGKYGHYPGRGGSCWYTFDNQEHRATSQVEVLTISVFGEHYCNMGY